jgi:CRP/FNR family transcriptional regulator, cyclic AMP receptor protein
VPGIITTDDWIARLSPEVNAAIEPRMAVFEVQAGAEFTHAGDRPGAIYRVTSGYLRLVALQEDGRQVLITIYGPGACFAETALISERPLNHTTVALTDARVGALREADFWPLYWEHREIADALTRKFAGIISTQILYREARATKRIAKRIADMFEDLAKACGRAQRDGAVEIPLPLTQSDIAEHFDVTRQTVHRELGALRSDKLVTKQGGGWLIANPVRLAEFS